jgi:hypothetical protein
MQLKDGFRRIRTLHVNGFYARSLKDYALIVGAIL